jgi:hypothetical protein
MNQATIGRSAKKRFIHHARSQHGLSGVQTTSRLVEPPSESMCQAGDIEITAPFATPSTEITPRPVGYGAGNGIAMRCGASVKLKGGDK